MKLVNDQHERFCQEYLFDLNQTKAAVRAKFSEKTAAQQASRLLTKVNIQERIAELKEIRSERTKVTQDMVIKELLILARSDFRDYGEIVKELGIDRLKLKKFSEMKGDVTRAIKSISEHITDKGVQLKFKLHGKEKALEMLGRHTGVFDESMRVETEIDKDNKLIIEVIRVREGEDKSK